MFERPAVSTPTRSAAPWDQRIARARALALDHASAREALTFFAVLLEYQRSLFLRAAAGRAAADFVDAVDMNAAAAAVPEFLAWLERTAPPALALAAGGLRDQGAGWGRLMRESLQRQEPEDVPECDAAKAFVVEAVLQPFAEAAARQQDLGRPSHPSAPRAPRCPTCSDRPCLGILREEGQGAKRTLLCARCGAEWEYLRVVCPGCGEEAFDRLPVYTADAFSHVRVEACDACRRYLKTIDLTQNGLAVPLVDDVASLPLDLWAGEKGYRRLRANLLRTSDPLLRRTT